MDADALAKMMRMIVPCRMQIASVDGTWKLSQNKPDDVRLRTADYVGWLRAGRGNTIVGGLYAWCIDTRNSGF